MAASEFKMFTISVSWAVLDMDIFTHPLLKSVSQLYSVHIFKESMLRINRI